MPVDRKPRGRPHDVSDPLRLRKDAIGIALSAIFEKADLKKKRLVPKFANYLANPNAEAWTGKRDDRLVTSFAPPGNATVESTDSALRYTRARLNGTSANKFGYTEQDAWAVGAGAELVLIVLTSRHVLVAQTFAKGLLEHEWPKAVIQRLLGLAEAWNVSNPDYFDLTLGFQELLKVQQLLIAKA
jgi:hypothetical protein